MQDLTRYQRPMTNDIKTNDKPVSFTLIVSSPITYTMDTVQALGIDHTQHT